MEWINVKDEKPQDGATVIVFAPDCRIIGSVLIGLYFASTDSFTVYDFYDIKHDETITHWMPRPEPPRD